ncbi:MAG TPA: CDP-alcohol phosphatidyltransferase family protein [Mycobacteriales bacterium]|nr:CDP-alcohol phosphatidyltransferase family protein [Mycobacteriales bacterium]
MTLTSAGLSEPVLTEDPWSLPNRITLARTLGALALGAAASAHHSLRLLAVAYAVYWVGDMLDGFVARRTASETRQGAVLDIVCDRASCGLLAGVFLAMTPDAAPAISLYLLQFMVVDCVLSLGFLHWPILSPNHFGQVDRRLYLWNWSPAAKVVNTAGLVLVVAAGAYQLAVVLAALQLAVKAASLVALARLLTGRRPA